MEEARKAALKEKQIARRLESKVCQKEREQREKKKVRQKER